MLLILNPNVGAEFTMILQYRSKIFFKVPFFLIIYLGLSFLTDPVFAHGPKGHSEMEFTALMAVKKGVELYDRLVASGKLDESWETELADIRVFTRNNNTEKEIVVQFKRSSGNPNSIYIFFTEKGEYNGSNFTGK
jgi:hypothetical protein